MTQGDTKIAHTATAGDGGERVRHVKRGTEYEVLGEAEAQVSEGMQRYLAEGAARIIYDGHLLTVYRCATTGKLWCRFTNEFRDGRFETISTSPTPTDAQPKAARPVGDEALRDLIREALVFLDMEDEANTPGTELYTWVKVAAEVVSTHPTTGQETVATPRDGGVREALVHLRKQAQECREEARKNLDQNHIPQHDWYIARAEALEEAANDVERSLSAPGSAGPRETPKDPVRLLKEALFACLKANTGNKAYGGVLAAPGKFAHVRFTIEDATPSPAQEPGTGDTGASHQRDMALEALHTLGVRLGVLDPAIACDGPQLLAAMSFYADSLPTPATTAETRGPAEGAR